MTLNSSILVTVQVPTFDSVSKQLSSSSHHLLSTPLSYHHAFGDTGYKLRFLCPPSTPYQSVIEDIEGEDEEGVAEELQRGKDDESESTTSNNTPGKRGRNVAATKKKTTTSKKQKVEPSTLTPQDFQSAREKEEKKSTTDKESQAHHESIKPMLESAIIAVRESWTLTPHSKSFVGKEDLQRERWNGTSPSNNHNSLTAWTTKKEEDAKPEEIDWIKLAPSEEVKKNEASSKSRLIIQTELDGHEEPISTYFNKIVVNGDDSMYLPFLPYDEGLGFATLIPEGSGFQMSDFSTWSKSGIAQEGKLNGGFNLMVIDSVTRSGSYTTFDPYSLGKLDLPALLGNTPCLVAIWVTNKIKFRNLIINKLFPQWKVATAKDEKAAEWYWVKITSNGEPVWNLENTSRRCYEGLIVGMYNPKGVAVPKIPLEKVFLAMPIGHSRKPVLTDLLRPYMPPSRNDRGPNVLELFARNTFAGLEKDEHTVVEEKDVLKSEEKEEKRDYGLSKRGLYLSVGNEPLKFNVLSTFDELEQVDYDHLMRVRGFVE